MARPIRNVHTKLTESFFQNVSLPWFFKELIRNLYEFAAEQSVHISNLSVVQISRIWLQNQQKTVF